MCNIIQARIIGPGSPYNNLSPTSLRRCQVNLKWNQTRDWPFMLQPKNQWFPDRLTSATLPYFVHLPQQVDCHPNLFSYPLPELWLEGASSRCAYAQTLTWNTFHMLILWMYFFSRVLTYSCIRRKPSLVCFLIRTAYTAVALPQRQTLRIIRPYAWSHCLIILMAEDNAFVTPQEQLF